ncbi:AmpG family muropeptide MFS transporter [Nisaea acidiphila]|uniref:AmpG family muropeptide MFS transporter n=1 Tax=Nisaea acidiphila TaxID=1862145 RepID=A0A9J7AWG4_9PROT|nr:AmpG family muropeptide MFS transporter [Nisaea acidiphila]UUX52147.1 AmpG family muropeptide MFS transporter [Nisaea acidiphila]
MADAAAGLRGWLAETAALYLKRRVLVVLLLGFSSGLPLLLSFSTLSAWMRESGVDLTTIAVFALVGTPFTLKFLWAPLMDRLAVPVLGRMLGRRRAWLLVTQLALMTAIVLMGATDPVATPWLMAFFAVIVSFCAASQDIVVDAFRIESLREDEQGAGAAAYTLGYRVGMLAAGAGALVVADQAGWFLAYLSMAALVLIGVFSALASPEPGDSPATDQPPQTPYEWLLSAVYEPFAEFLTRRGAVLILAFILLYKLGDAFLGTLTNPFYIDLGFSKTEIAQVTKLFGLVALLVGLFAGGALVKRLGLLKALLVSGVLQALSNLIFVAQALAGHDIWMLTATIGVENFTGGMGTAAFVAYLSSLTNVAFTATQYALLSSFMAFGRTVLSSGGGWITDHIGWIGFFLASTAIAVPGLILLLVLMRMFPPERSGGVVRAEA